MLPFALPFAIPGFLAKWFAFAWIAPILEILAKIPRPVWYVLIFGACLWAAYTKGDIDGTAEERARQQARIERQRQINDTLTKQLAEASERIQHLASEVQIANDRLHTRLENEPSLDVFPDDWLRDLRSTR